MNSLRQLTVTLTLAVILSSGITAEELMHVVGKGETIYSISRFYQVTPEELMKANKISDPSRLQSGKRLVIPVNAFQDIAVPAGKKSATETASPVNYQVVKGDTLFSIARTNGITLQELLDLNKFSSGHVIKLGDTIKVPGKAAAFSSSVSVNSGAGTSVSALRWPVNARDVAYMTGQMGVIVEGEHFEPVKSLTQGKVISAGPWRKFGKVAIVETAGGYFYMYGGCESLSVKVGDKVTAGAEVGKLGINSVSEKPQLFFMVFQSDIPIDPAKAPRAGTAKSGAGGSAKI